MDYREWYEEIYVMNKQFGMDPWKVWYERCREVGLEARILAGVLQRRRLPCCAPRRMFTSFRKSQDISKREANCMHARSQTCAVTVPRRLRFVQTTPSSIMWRYLFCRAGMKLLFDNEIIEPVKWKSNGKGQYCYTEIMKGRSCYVNNNDSG